MRNKMEKGRGSVRLKFWQKTYLLTLALFLLALGGGTTAIASVSQRAFEAECGKLLAQQHSVAQSLAADAAAVQARRPEALPRLAQNYAGQLKRSGVFLRVAQAGDVWADELPQPDSALPEVPPEGQRVHTVLLSGGRHVLYISAVLPAPPEDVAVTCAFDMEAFFVQWAQTRRAFLLAGAAVSAVLAAALYVVLRGLSRPMERLARVSERVSDKLILIPRVYTNKPRTTGGGYKGMLHQPNPEKKPNMYEGLVAIRKLHMRAIQDYGFSTADEMLYPENYSYLSDVLSYIAIGARSVENQQHRLTSSGVDVPVGMKNPTGGDLGVMLNAVYAAQHGHDFIYRTMEVTTDGNPLAHTILRGAVSKHGQCIPNYHYEDLELLLQLYGERELVNPACIVDVNHSNSNKRYEEQVRIVKEVLHSRRYSPDIHKFVKGVMIESYLEPGSQKIGEHIYGKSITDPCLGWEESERLLYDIAEEI